jgi:predicted homoserine dehydrogenase-like protein
MNYHSHYASAQRPVETCVVGSGGFGRSFLAQGRRVPLMNARIAVDRESEIAVAALRSVGVAPADIAVCNTAAEARQAWAQGRFIASAELSAVVELPIDLVVEATGHPEAGARHSRIAIEAGHHLALASKEVDSVIGPGLARLAQQRGRVITPVDGDQPSLLIGLLTWAQTLGFEIVAAGKSSEYDFVFDAARGTMTSNGQTVPVPGFGAHWAAGERALPELAAARAQVCAALPQRAVPDLCELLVVANATGLAPDRPQLHAPIARIPEVASMFGLQQEGGLLGRGGTLDVFHCLRSADEASFAGGVFVIIRCDDRETWELLAAKGHLLSRDGQRAMLYLPRHLLGLEAATSVLDAVLHGQSSGAQAPAPRLDLVARSTRALKAGSVLEMGGHHHSIDGTVAELVPAAALAPGVPLPFYLAANRRLVRDIQAGAPICFDDVEIDAASELLALRRGQDAAFFGPATRATATALAN